MSDIVERLRARDAYLSLDEAADEIDRLREALRLIANNASMERESAAIARNALAGAAVQPSALPERCSVCGGAHDVGNPCRATSPTKAGQPERCCLDYPRCDCNSPPEPAQEPKGCNHFPGQVNCEWCTEVPHE